MRRIRLLTLGFSLLLCLPTQADSEHEVGMTRGHFNVSGGQASYDIPITVVPGRGGMQPSLSFNYNSAMGNGQMGYGWNLTGVSVISRCGSTIAQDGVRGAVTFGAGDHYCLDGQRLVAVAGVYGAVGTEYRLEIDGGSRVKSVGGTANNPAQFVVNTKSGQTMTFGSAGGSVLTLPQGRLLWLLSTVRDTTADGNAINYSYFIDHNTQYLSAVSYAGGRVDITYESRTDPSMKRFYGQSARVMQRLSRVRVSHAGQTVREYQVTYDNFILGPRNARKMSAVKRIQECVAGAVCYGAIKFGWGYNAPSSRYIGFFSNGHSEAFPYSWNFGAVKDSNFETVSGDFNGDGLSDFLRMHGTAMHIMLADGQGGFTGHGQAFPHSWNFGAVKDRNYETVSGDFNGDGLSDFLRMHGTAMHIMLADGQGGFTGHGQAFPHSWNFGAVKDSNYETVSGDFNGDGLSDFLRMHGTAMHIMLADGQGGFTGHGQAFPHSWNFGAVKDSNYETVSGDFNGDGLSDFLRMHGTAMHIMLADGQGGFTGHGQAFPHSWNFGAVKDSNYETVSGDFNGDGLSDFLRMHGTAMHIMLADGQGGFTGHGQAFPHSWNFGAVKDRNYETVSGDFNSDGLSDFLRMNGAYMYILLADGQGGFTGHYQSFPHPWNFGAVKDEHYETLSGDFNGDGLSDFLRMNGTNMYLLRNYYQRPRMRSIKDSHGNTTYIRYRPLTDGDVYTQGTGAQYPVVDVQSAQHVVSRVDSVNGIGGRHTVEYRYEGLKFHMTGRGSYGYARETAYYRQTGKREVTEYDQSAFPIAGNVSRRAEYLGDQLLNESITHYSVSSHHAGVNSLHADQTVERSYELNGELITQVTLRSEDIDAWGNVGQVTVTTEGGGESVTQITQSQYAHPTDRWHLGRLSEASSEHITAQGHASVRTTRFSYDGSTGLLQSESLISSTGEVFHTTTYDYDDYGQKTTTTVSVPGEEERRSTVAYDTSGRPVETCDAIGQCTTTSYNDQGLAATVTDYNGLTVSYDYDGFGRKIKETRPDGTETTIAYHFIDSGRCGALAAYTHYCKITQTTAQPPHIEQYSQQGRTVRKITTGLNGLSVYHDTEYDALGRVARVSRPYFAGETRYWANSQYDALGRIIRTTEPAPHGGTHIIEHTFNGLTTTTHSGPDKRRKITVKNALGQTLHVEQEEGAYIDYTYTANGELLTTTVAANSDTTLTLSYDEQGRKIRMQDPDKGDWSYQYDGFGQLIQQTDAKGQVVNMQYDPLGRMIERSDDEGTTTWTYGGLDAPAGSIGQLLEETHGEVSTTYQYDTLGRVTRTTKTLEGTEFTTTVHYDDLGRVIKTDYPGGQGLYTENHYDDLGFLTKVTGNRLAGEAPADLNTLIPLIDEALDLAGTYLDRADALRELGQHYRQLSAAYQDELQRPQNNDTRGNNVALNKPATLSHWTDIGIDHYAAASNAVDGSQAEPYSLVGLAISDRVIAPWWQVDLLVPHKLQTITLQKISDRSSGSRTLNYQLVIADQADFSTDTYTSDTYTIDIDYNSDKSVTHTLPAGTTGRYVRVQVVGDRLVALSLGEVEIEGIPIVNQALTAHQQQLQTYTDAAWAANTGDDSEPTLTGDFLGHLQNALDQLARVTQRLDSAAEDYETQAEQLIVLADQTLMSADHQAHYVRTLEAGATAYQELTHPQSDSLTWWQALDADASGRITAEVYGNGLVNDHSYNQATGQLQVSHSSRLSDPPIRHLEYGFDAYQNQIWRHDRVNDIQETWLYDRIDRLKRSTFTSARLLGEELVDYQVQTYDALGNLRYKSDVGNYRYDDERPHAVSQAGDTHYQYDANGNMLSANNRTVTWRSDNKPLDITQGTQRVTFSYDGAGSRYKKVNSQGDTTWYVGSLYERHQRADSTRHQHYIFAAGRRIASHSLSETEQSNQVTTYYLHQDALGSIDTLTDPHGAVIERRSYDAWGKQRRLNWRHVGLPLPLALSDTTTRGYTDHEMLDEVGLIHMNGRVYDPSLARFISADPHIQSPGHSQSYNRYAYVINNPNKYNDPSGYFFKKLFRSIEKVVSNLTQSASNLIQSVKNTARGVIRGVGHVLGRSSLGVITNLIAGALSGFCGPAVVICYSAIVGFAQYQTARAYGASPSQAMRGATIAGAASYLGAMGANWVGGTFNINEGLGHRITNAVGNGIVGGGISAATGGDFGEGFIASAFAAAFKPLTFKIGEGDTSISARINRTAFAAMIGGTASALGGGKFANGAASAAFTHWHSSERGLTQQEQNGDSSSGNETGSQQNGGANGDTNGSVDNPLTADDHNQNTDTSFDLFNPSDELKVASLFGPDSKIIGHPAYGGRTIGIFRGRYRFGWSQHKGPVLRFGIGEDHYDLYRPKRR